MPPTVTISSPGSKVKTRRSTANVTVNFVASDVHPGTLSCKLDGGGFATCSTGQVYNNVKVGTHTISIRATDAAGNATIESRTFKVVRVR